MKRLSSAVLIFSMTVTSAQAASCKALNLFAKDGTPPLLESHTETCSTSRQLGGKQSVDCYWAFDYRSPNALTTFENLKQALVKCSDVDLEREEDRVNHPDSFVQVTTKVSGSTLSLSLKDKAGLNQTLVFLRVTQPQ